MAFIKTMKDKIHLSIRNFDVPSGNRHEIFENGYINYGDFPTITWTEDKIGQDIFYDRRELIKSFGKAFT
jgi:catechol 2,3-dioxygenase